MLYEHEGKRIPIKGDPTLTRKIVEPKALLKMKEVEVVTLVWSLGRTEVNREDEDNQELTMEQKVELKQVLEHYPEVFEEPWGLPPDTLEGRQ